MMVADSLVRGTTSKEIIQMAKEVGARKVIFASCAPPIRYASLLARQSSLDIPSSQVLQRVRYRHAFA